MILVASYIGMWVHLSQPFQKALRDQPFHVALSHIQLAVLGQVNHAVLVSIMET